MVNIEIIRERLKEIDENVRLLEDLRDIPYSEFIADLKTYKATERCLEICIQCILDICHHIIATNNWPRPQTNSESLTLIAQRKILPVSFARKITPMIGLRNLLVHEYTRIDPKIIYKSLKKTSDFKAFQRHILAYLKKRKK